MKILYYSPHPALNLSAQTGYGTHMREMIRAFREAGHEVKTCIRGGEQMPVSSGGATAGNGKRLLKKIIPRFLWRTLKERRLMREDKISEAVLAKAMEEFQPDVIYERAAYLCISGRNVAVRKKIPHIVEVNAPFEEEVRGFEKAGSMLAAAGKKRMNELLDDAARVITVSSALAGYLAERYGVKKEKITVTPNCVDPGAVNVSPAKAEQLRRKYFPGKKTVIGFVGSIFPYHGVDILIRAFAELHRQHSETGLFIVGDGYLIPELKELASALGCGDSVVFTGSVPHADIFDHIAAMDITVMADSNWYGSPVKIFEYGCAGKPVIAPDTVPVRDVMENGTDGLLVKPGKNELLSALLQMMNDPEKTSGMARHFREKIVSTCTWKRAAEKALLSL